MRFSGHQTFPFRYTWLPKGLLHLQDMPDLFVRDDAMVILGVGKNMVGAIRYWCESLELIEPSGRGQMSPTMLGNSLLAHDGWDPYLEDVATLWLFHWLLARSPDRASTWHLAFTQFPYNPFSRPQLMEWLAKVIADKNLKVSANTLKRDVDVFLRTYVAPESASHPAVLEDSWDCPLTELELVEAIGAGLYHFPRGYKASLPQEVFIYALLDFWQQESSAQPSITFEKLAHGAGSPGQVFKLSENALVERLEQLPEPLRFDETAGLRLVLSSVPIESLEKLVWLERFYQGQREAAYA